MSDYTPMTCPPAVWRQIIQRGVTAPLRYVIGGNARAVAAELRSLGLNAGAIDNDVLYIVSKQLPGGMVRLRRGAILQLGSAHDGVRSSLTTVPPVGDGCSPDPAVRP